MLAIYQTGNKDLMLLQNNWTPQLNALLGKQALQVSLLKQINLTTGSNTINHLLGRELVGWYITDINAPATVYRSAPKNNLTLTLTSSANCTVDIVVF